MKGMRTKGTDYDTNFGVLATNTGVELPLGRLQRTADHISQLDNPPVSGNTICELKKNGEVQFKGTYNECLHKLHNSTSYSWDWAMKHEGWSIDPVATEKTAAIYDTYGTRVTIETKSGDTNESYTMVLDMLKGIDILYREVRRYTVDPDRVVLEIMVRKQDLELIQELAKEAEKEGVKIYLSNNISEKIKSKTVVTDDENLEQKVTAKE